MAEPVQHGNEWWTRGPDGSWLRWNAADYRWDPQPGPPPPGVEQAEPGPAPPAPAPRTRYGGLWDAPPPSADAPRGPNAQRLREFDPLEGKALAARALVGLTSATSLIIGPWALQRAFSGDAVFVESPALAGLSTFSLFAMVASIVAVLVWFKSAYDNAPALTVTDLRYTPGWAIGGWFIPIGNLFIPKQLTDDLWRTSEPGLPAPTGAKWMFKPVPAVLHVWWAAWVIQLILGRVADRLSTDAIDNIDPAAYKVAVALEGVSALLLALAGALFIKIVRDLTVRQRARAQTLQQLFDQPLETAQG